MPPVSGRERGRLVDVYQVIAPVSCPPVDNNVLAVPRHNWPCIKAVHFVVDGDDPQEQQTN